ncbi:hypothetical protein CRX54_27155 [Klebsiella oxytoca]|nr:hypothetical protein CRX54_27155 [Klebsiella oxytoca]
METDAQITSWPGYDGIVREAGYTNATYPVTQNAEMACITGGVHIRQGASRRPREQSAEWQNFPEAMLRICPGYQTRRRR